MSLVPCIYRYSPIDKLREEFLAVRHWLSPTECKILGKFGNPLRRETWLAGRWLAKGLIVGQIDKNMPSGNGNAGYDGIEILSAGRKPQALLKGKLLPWSLSIAHTRHGAMAALSCRTNITPGVDLVELRDYGPGFSSLWFTESERRRWGRSGNCGYAVVWAIKEALYKAVNDGEPFDPRTIETIPCGSSGDALWFRVRGKKCLCRLMLWRVAMNEIAIYATHFKGDNDD